MIKLKSDRLMKSPTLFRQTVDGPLLNRTIYSYNAVNGLYDVCVDEVLGVWFRTNCRRVNEPTKYHVALMVHYGVNT